MTRQIHPPKGGETNMIRKLPLAAVAALALGTAALAPTSASAWHGGWHGGWGWGGPRFYGFYGGGYSCQRWVWTPWGYQLRWVC
jgi:hypothetical protein